MYTLNKDKAEQKISSVTYTHKAAILTHISNLNSIKLSGRRDGGEPKFGF